MPSSAPSAARTDPAGTPAAWTVAAAVIVALAAFVLYRATLLPGVDFGDTGSLQTMVGSPHPSPRDAYPLYFAIAGSLLWLTGGEPAHVLNLASALEGAVACGLLVLVAAELSGSLAAAIAAALLFAGSYTFWSQCVIGEVYALHIVFVLLTLLLLLRWAARPTMARLALFLGCYALGFGNHLAMILLAPAFTLFVLASAPGGWRAMLAPRVLVLAGGAAVAGALQYLWNFRTMWMRPDPPGSLMNGLAAFWFDVTKTDWRETTVLDVPQSMLRDHAAMFWFDVRQQFGIVGSALAVIGIAWLARRHLRRAVLLLLVYVANVAFAFSYNVGDAHVFYLPSHVVIALLAACGVVAIAAYVGSAFRRRRRLRRTTEALAAVVRRTVAGPAFATTCAVLLALYAGSRIYRDFPALDRSGDRRPLELLEALTSGLDDQRAILLTDLNWQVANGLSYFTRATRPEVAVAWMPDVRSHAPALVADNAAVGREVAATERSRAALAREYGSVLHAVADARVPVASLSAATSSLTPGTRYVICVLRPSRDLQLDRAELAATLRQLGDGQQVEIPGLDYAAAAGRVGARPQWIDGSDRPFSARVDLGGVGVTIRMESWLAADTIRRMGFGHVIAQRSHALIVERGISFVAFDEQGRALRRAYASNIFEPQRRYLISMR